MAKETRYVTIPETITVKVKGLPDEDVPFVAVVVDNLLNDVRFGAGREALRQARDIEDLFENAKPGDVVAMPGSLHKMLADVCKQPRFGARGDAGFAPHIMRQLASYLDAIIDAPTEDPRPKVEEPKVEAPALSA